MIDHAELAQEIADRHHSEFHSDGPLETRFKTAWPASTTHLLDPASFLLFEVTDKQLCKEPVRWLVIAWRDGHFEYFCQAD